MSKANPILRLLVRVTEFSPWLRRLVWHRWYQYLAGYTMKEWRFMNYGYVPLDDSTWKELDLQPEDEEDRLAIQLYHFVARQSDLSGREVLEVGCGRGGGASFLSRYHQPAAMTGLDYSQKVIRYCQKNRSQNALTFVHGKAESLPFDDAQFDTVVNVESSHCYGSMSAFLDQVKRVLKPGGQFLFADFRHSDALEKLDSCMNDSGLRLVAKADITANVLEAMRRDSSRKLELIDRWAGNRFNGTIQQFAGVEGSEVFEGFQNRDIIYMSYHLEKS